jgi:hypothetical protein
MRTKRKRSRRKKKKKKKKKKEEKLHLCENLETLTCQVGKNKRH